MSVDAGEVFSRSVGSQVGRYRLLAGLGTGGMAEVFLAVSQGPAGFNKLFAVKMLRRNLAAAPELVTQFLDEARLAACLNHPNVIQIFEVSREGSALTIVMEYLEGQALGHVVEQCRKAGEALPLELHLRVLSDALTGLHYAHEATDLDGKPMHIVHRDVTPHNLFVTYEGHVKVLDFGIAKAVNSIAQTRTGITKGTVRYMAPEHVRGEVVDRRADVFAVGVMLWEALTGERMFKGLGDVVVLNHVARGEIPRAASVRPDIPQQLGAICEKALAFERDDRYATCLELHDAIEGYLVSSGLTSSNRQLAGVLEARFAPRRQQMKSLVDVQLNRLTSLGPDDQLDLPTLGSPNSSRLSSPLPITSTADSLAVERAKVGWSNALKALLFCVLLALVLLGLLAAFFPRDAPRLRARFSALPARCGGSFHFSAGSSLG